MSVSNRLVKNSVSSSLSRLWQALTTFFLMPYMLHSIGKDALGVYTMLLLIITFFGYADLGVSTALPKFVAQYAAKDDVEGLERVVNAGIAFYGTVALVGTAISVAVSWPYLHFVKTPSAILNDAHAAFMWLILVTGICVVTTASRGILVGLQRVYLINAVEVAVSVPILFATIGVLWTGQGILGLAVVQFAQFGSIGAILLVLVIRNLPNVRVNPFRTTRAALQGLLTFSWRVACPTIALVMHGQVERMLLSNLVGPGSVGLFGFGTKPVDTWKGMLYPTFNSVMAAASHLDAVDEPKKVHMLYTLGAKILCAVVFPSAMWMFAIAPVFVAAWLGPNPGWSMVVIAMRLLALTGLVQMGIGVVTAVARGLGRLNPDVISSAFVLIVFFPAVLLMGRHYGYTGILLAGLLIWTANSLITLTLVHRAFRWPLLSVICRVYLPPLAISVLAAFPAYWYSHVHKVRIVELGLAGHRLPLIMMGIGQTVAFAAIYLGVMWASRYVTRADAGALRRAIKGDTAPSPAAEAVG